MPPITYPNQRLIRIHRERAASDFLGIKNANWQAAARDLGAHATMLYLYLASNANNYTAALSPVAVRQAIGMARSTYHDQFHTTSFDMTKSAPLRSADSKRYFIFFKG